MSSENQETIPVSLYRNQLLPWHRQIRQEWNQSPYKVIACGRKARKTTFVVNELLRRAMTDERGLTYPIIGPTRVQEKEIVWDDHVAKVLLQLKQAGLPFKVNNSELSVKFEGYGKFYVDGSDNIESLRGKSDWGGVGLDEFAFWSNPAYAWEEVVEPNLIVNHAFAIIASTTNGYDYFHRLIKRGDHENLIEGTAFDDDGNIIVPSDWYRSYRHSSHANPHLDPAWLEAKRLTMSEEAYNREYLARFEKFRGLIYKEFDRKININDNFELHLGWQYYRTMDFGAVNPTVCLWIAVDNSDNIYVYDEYFGKGQTAEFHTNIIAGKTLFDYQPIATFGDPSAQQEILDYANHGIVITPASKVFSGDINWVNSGIEKVRQALKVNPQTGKPRLYIHPRCTNTIREFESYHWLEAKSTGMVKDIPEKTDDHCMDALRYFMVSYKQNEGFDYNFTPQPRMNSFTGYSQAPDAY